MNAAAFLQCMLPLPPPANVPPQASFIYSCTDLMCDFTDQSSDSDGMVSSWSWTFGEGGSSTQGSPTHTYAAAGPYTVSLTVTDDDGASHTFSQTFSVTEPPPTTAVPPPSTTALPAADCNSITNRDSCNAENNCYWGNRKRKPTNRTGRRQRCYDVSECPRTSCK